MSRFIDGLPLAQAQALIQARLACVAPERAVGLSDALGLVASRPVLAPAPLPAFARSTVDGYAVHSLDTFGAEEGSPALLVIDGEILMGRAETAPLPFGAARHMPTGGMLPPAADAVVMVEHCEAIDEQTVLVHKRVAPGENVVQAGEDVPAAQRLLAAGRRIRPEDIGLLAACGVRSVFVRVPLRVGILSTGDELVEADRPLQPGEIRDSNRPMLAALLREAGAEVVDYGIVRDAADALAATLAQAVQACQLVLLSGGSSMGQRDYAAETIDGLGPPGVVVHGLAIKPGRPTIVGFAGKVPVFGLPGHPAAAMTVFRLLVAPVLRQLCGAQADAAPLFSARLTRNVASAPGRDDFVSVRLVKRADGLWAEPVFGRSGLLSVMTEADGVLHIPSASGGCYGGAWVEVTAHRWEEAMRGEEGDAKR